MSLTVTQSDSSASRGRDRSRRPTHAARTEGQTAAAEVLDYITLTPSVTHSTKVAHSTGLAIALLNAEH